MGRKIYVASSWRNELQPAIVKQLREDGHQVYDFRNPPHGLGGFAWSEVDPGWKGWTSEEYRTALEHPISQRGFNNDLDGMAWADTCLLVLPAGRSSHLELGWMEGRRKLTLILTQDGHEPELMALLAGHICISMDEVRTILGRA
jgi:hypothetical protein